MAGVAWPIAFLATVVSGGLASPVFSWPTDPFSVVGTTGDATAAAFNAGLVATGIVALVFAAWLWRRYHRAVGAVAAVVAASTAGAGLFPAGQVAHAAFGAGLLVGAWVWLWAAAGVDWRRGNAGPAAVAFLLGTAAVAVWLPYDLGVAWAQLGYGFAELVTVAAVGSWSVWTAARAYRDPSSPAGDGPPPRQERSATQ